MERWRARSFSALLWLIGLVPLLYNLLIPPRFTDLQAHFDAGDAPTLIRRAAVVLVLCWIPVVALMFRQRPTVPVGKSLLWAGLYFHLTLIVSMFMGLKPLLSLGGFIFPALLMLVPFVIRRIDQPLVVRVTKSILAVYVYGSLLAGVVWTSHSVEIGYAGVIPLRLHGLATHANALAVLAALLVLVERWFPSQKPWSMLNQAVGLLVVFLTQSKTVWIILLLVLPSFRWFTLRGARKFLFAVLAAGTLTIVGFYLAATPSIITNYLDDHPNYATFSGRTDVWSYTVDTWRRSPWFGYGYETLWDEDMRDQFALVYRWMPGYAHSQWFETLGEAGVLGISGLVPYALLLAYESARLSKVSRGASLGMGALLLVRGVTEVTLSHDITSEALVIHVCIVLLFLLALEKERTSLAAAHSDLPRLAGAEQPAVCG